MLNTVAMVLKWLVLNIHCFNGVEMIANCSNNEIEKTLFWQCWNNWNWGTVEIRAWMHCSYGLALIKFSKHCSVVLELLTEGVLFQVVLN